VSGSADPFAAAACGLERAGMNALGRLSRDRYDALVPAAWRCGAVAPSARSALLIGSGGRALFEAFSRAPERRLERDPLDAYTRRVAGEAARSLVAAGFETQAFLAFETRGGAFADLVALGEACGLGAPSRLGLLLHPRFGPWLSLRALLLTALELPPTPALDGFDPCPTCPAPCASACHGRALASTRIDVVACGATRARETACALRCDARRACPVGAEHAYSPHAEAHHMRHARLPQRARAASR
jgi:hypothetical protein